MLPECSHKRVAIRTIFNSFSVLFLRIPCPHSIISFIRMFHWYRSIDFHVNNSNIFHYYCIILIFLRNESSRNMISHKLLIYSFLDMMYITSVY